MLCTDFINIRYKILWVCITIKYLYLQKIVGTLPINYPPPLPEYIKLLLFYHILWYIYNMSYRAIIYKESVVHTIYYNLPFRIIINSLNLNSITQKWKSTKNLYDVKNAPPIIRLLQKPNSNTSLRF